MPVSCRSQPIGQVLLLDPSSLFCCKRVRNASQRMISRSLSYTKAVISELLGHSMVSPPRVENSSWVASWVLPWNPHLRATSSFPANSDPSTPGCLSGLSMYITTLFLAFWRGPCWTAPSRLPQRGRHHSSKQGCVWPDPTWPFWVLRLNCKRGRRCLILTPS